MNKLVQEARALREGLDSSERWSFDDLIDALKANAVLVNRSRTLLPEMADEIERLTKKLALVQMLGEDCKAELDSLKARAEAAEKERDALIAAIRDKDACRTCVHCLKDGCSAVRNGWRCRYVHPSESGPQEGANQ